MALRERQRPEREQVAVAADPGGSNLAALTTAAERLLAAADEALDRVLSGDSDAFLAANRQHGGE